MGWAFYHVDAWNGKIDRKAECDALYTWRNEQTGDTCRVLKSSMVGSTWYGACERTRPDGTTYVFAGICPTRLDSKEYCNFGYKDMDESCGPFQHDCPVSILNLLSPTEYEYAAKWRETCRENAAKKAAAKKDQNSLENLPLNATVKVNRRGEEILLQKAKIAGRKRPVWVSWSDRIYYTAAQVKNHGYILHSVA